MGLCGDLRARFGVMDVAELIEKHVPQSFGPRQLGASGKIDDGLLQYSIISIKDKDPKFEKDLIYPLAKDHHHPSSICNGLLLLLVREKDTKPPGKPDHRGSQNPTSSTFIL
ncbi:DNA-directed RNA polymerase subunit beta'' [Striga asiatica]|uniref:DNA-directed RNA polymerase subunit beta n=1 Tax=Striga asiatica TaxID=4170 RepID=A0A5A7RI58_STRAF|nr:DNA-directed RNA polymerase subunit beta'' [Striga asiatica]